MFSLLYYLYFYILLSRLLCIKTYLNHRESLWVIPGWQLPDRRKGDERSWWTPYLHFHPPVSRNAHCWSHFGINILSQNFHAPILRFAYCWCHFGKNVQPQIVMGDCNSITLHTIHIGLAIMRQTSFMLIGCSQCWLKVLILIVQIWLIVADTRQVLRLISEVISWEWVVGTWLGRY